MGLSQVELWRARSC